MKNIVFYFIFSIIFLCPEYSIAITSPCLKKLHSQAVMDAINSMPTDAKNILKQFEGDMQREVRDLHARPESERSSYKSSYKDLVTMASEDIKNRYEYMTRALVDITIHIFDQHNPIRTSESCDEGKIIKEAYVVYDGYDNNPDYSAVENIYFAAKTEYRIVRSEDKLIIFYNTLVNEILDLWTNIWIDAGRDIKVLPAQLSYIRGSEINLQKLIASLNKYNFETFNREMQELKGEVLSNMSDSKSSSSSGGWSDCEGKAKERGLGKSKTAAGMRAYTDFMAICQSSASTQGNSNNSSMSWEDCDSKALSSGIKKEFKLKASVDAYNDFMAVCTGSERPVRRETVLESNKTFDSGINPGAINTTTGEFYPGAAGGVINPRTGQFYPDVGGGYINPQNGRFMPKQ